MPGLSGQKIKTIPPFITSSDQISEGVITVQMLNVDELSAITANMGTLTAGTITGSIFATSLSGKRIVVDGTQDTFTVYDANGNDVMDVWGSNSSVIMRILPHMNNMQALTIQNDLSVSTDIDLVEISVTNPLSIGNALFVGNAGQGIPLVVVNAYSATSPVISISQNVATSTDFALEMVLNGVSIWKSDGTNPAGVLTGTTGDICLNGPEASIWYCLSSNVWVPIDYLEKFGDGSDGQVVTTGSTTLTRDMFYESLTIGTGSDFFTNGFKVYCQTPIIVEGFVANNGGAGGTGGTAVTNGPTGGAGGTGGTAAPGGTLPAGIAGGAGGAGGTGEGANGHNGSNGNNAPSSYFTFTPASSGAGGGGQGFGSQGGNPGNQGSPGVSTQVSRVSSLWEAILMAHTTGATPGGGGGGGAGVQQTSPNTVTGGGGGGGGGAPGGIVWMCAPAIVVTGTGHVEALGGNGGAGGDGGAITSGPLQTGGGGGGGGAGGDGGLIVFVTPYYSNSGQVLVTAGTGGIYGVALFSGQQGISGNNGQNGLIVQIIP